MQQLRLRDLQDVQGKAAVLTVVPRERTEVDVARHMLRWLQRIGWTKGKALVSVVAGLHLFGAYTLLFAPNNQLFTQGTRPVFELFPPLVWALAFLIGGTAALTLLFRVTAAGQIITWATVLPTQAVWISASIMAVLRGGGSAMGVVFLSAVWLFTAITALVMAFDFTTGKR